MKIIIEGRLRAKEIWDKEGKNGSYQVAKFSVAGETIKGKYRDTNHGIIGINVFGDALCYNLQNINVGEEIKAEITIEIATFEEKETGKIKDYNRFNLVNITRKSDEKSMFDDIIEEDFGKTLEKEAEKKNAELKKEDKPVSKEEEPLPF